MINAKERREFRKTYWKGIFGSSMKFRIYQCITHNIYKEKIMNVNYCNDMARLASKFLVEEGRYNLPQLMIKFKQVLSQRVKRRPITNKYAMNLLMKMARKTYGVDVQVRTMKSPDYHIKIAFLLDLEDQLIDNVKSYNSNRTMKL